MRLILDLDDTLVDMMGKALYYYNNHLNQKYANEKFIEYLSMGELRTWDLPNRDMFESIWRIPGFFADLPWMDSDAPKVLRELRDLGHELVIVSAVPTWESCRDKYQWCHTHLKIPGIIKSMDQVILTRGKHYIVGDCMVDDKPSNLLDRRFPIIFDRPWNQGASGYARALNWSGVLKEVLGCEQVRRTGGATYYMGGTL